MNKINVLAGLMIGFTALFATSCSDDLDHNPTLKKPTTFVLNTPGYSSTTVNLAVTDSLGLSWSQPDYGFPAAAHYEMQVSTADNWTISEAKAATDESGVTKPTFVSVGMISTTCKAKMAAGDLAKGLQKIERWAQNAVPSTQKVYARVAAIYSGDTIYSNAVNFDVVPYYVELRDAAPINWYLVGSCIGDGSWGNTEANVGVSLVSLYMIEGETYDKVTGEGKISYTDYFPAGGQFKLILTPGSWDTQIAYNDFTDIASNSAFATNSDGNVVVNTAGFYTITVDTKTRKAKIEAYTGTPTVYANIFLAGDYNSWNTAADPMTAISTYAGAQNHNWKKNVTFPADGGFKFTDASTWWGAKSFPYGTANTTAGNGACKAGKYDVFFNDITGQFCFVAKE